VRIRLVLGAAGSGKTFRCLSEAKEEMIASPEGLPLLFIAPKQGTYQLEQLLLANKELAGYTRLRIVSFEALTHFILKRLRSAPRILDEEGRLMVLRNLLSSRRESLKVFRASAKLSGFAQQLSLVLHEFQRHGSTPELLAQLASEVGHKGGLDAKLQDLATLMRGYVDWLGANDLQDSDSLLTTAAAELRATRRGMSGSQTQGSLFEDHSDRFVRFARVWIDGFSEFSEQELDLLLALASHCGQMTITFCLDPAQRQQGSWLSHWSNINRSYEECHKRFALLPGAGMRIEQLSTDNGEGRFSHSPVLQHLATNWAERLPFGDGAAETSPTSLLAGSLRVAICADPEAEARLAAREVLRHVRAGGRYREVSVIVRRLEGYHSILQRVFTQYEIPFFLDRRESVAHHPLAELTRSALRIVAFGWQHEDWFAALKSGLMPAQDKDIDLLENEALARGWRGSAWLNPIRLKESDGMEEDQDRRRKLEEHLEQLRQRLVLPFEQLRDAIGVPQRRLSGGQLGSAVGDFWKLLKMEERLASWETADPEHDLTGTVVSAHETVWNQVNAWLENAELAFPNATLTLREWLPVLEASLAGLTVGVIPPALDQVLIGAIDRSRTPNIKLALVLGLNETIFPALPVGSGLLSETDRLELERRNVIPGTTVRHHLSRERYLAYIACTRPSERLVLTCASCDAQGTPLNPSGILTHLRSLFPALLFESDAKPDWRASEHVHELVGPLLKLSSELPPGVSSLTDLLSNLVRPAEATIASISSPSNVALNTLAATLKQVQQLQCPSVTENLPAELAGCLYGPVLRSSVSRMEQFATCPFKFFIDSGLRAEERRLFELDSKEQGSFQHEVLARFHQGLESENKRWRDITPAQARARVAAVAGAMLSKYREGLFETSEQTRFMARVLIESLQDFIETLVGWMREQYQFDPVAVELPFGPDAASPAWVIPLGKAHRLELYGRIDRIDVHAGGRGEKTHGVVIDYKSSHKQLDTVLIAYGIQLQLLTYLNVLRQSRELCSRFGVGQFIPAGVFYVGLRGRYERQPNRTVALAGHEDARKLAYRHSGRFDAGVLRLLDSRLDVSQGDQFNYRLTANGELHKNLREALPTKQFEALLASVEENLKKMGQQIYAGASAVAPYRKGADTACDQCGFQAICRVDPWTQPYRVLRPDRPGKGLQPELD